MTVLALAVGELDHCNPRGLRRPIIDTTVTSVPPRPSAVVSSSAAPTPSCVSEDGAARPVVLPQGGGAGTIAGRVTPGARIRLYPDGPVVEARRVVHHHGSVVIRFAGGMVRWPYHAPVEVLR